MIILVGPSASGKTVIANELVTKYNFKKFVTSTSRTPRNREVNGLDYNFLTVDTFLKKKENNEFIETTFYNGNYYGTEKKLIDLYTVLIVETSGLKEFKKLNDKNIISYFLKVDENIRKERMIYRGDSQEEIQKRIIHDKIKFSDDSLLPFIDKIIEEKDKTIAEISKELYEDYLNRIKK